MINIVTLSFFILFFHNIVIIMPLIRQLPWQQEQVLGQMLLQRVARVAPREVPALQQAVPFF